MKKIQIILHVLALVVLITGGTILATTAIEANQYPCCDTLNCADPHNPGEICRVPIMPRSEGNQYCSPDAQRILVSQWCNGY